MRYAVTFTILFANWLIWSGMFDAFHLSLGIISCSIVTYMSHDLLFKSERVSTMHLKEFLRFLKYIPWLLYQITISNIHLVYLTLHPRMPIEPAVVSYKSRLKKEISKVVFANSITLTPGTITAEITEEGCYIVHCITKKVADDLFSGEMENRVARIFGED